MADDWRAQWRRWRKPPDWDRLGGPEYTALSLLPPDEAWRVWREAWNEALRRPRVFLWFVLMSMPIAVLVLTILIAARRAGWGWGGRVSAEVVVHAVLALIIHRRLFRMMAEVNRPFVRDQLLADFG